MAHEDAEADFDTDDKGKPCVVVTLRESSGFGMRERDYVYLSLEQAMGLQRELEDAIHELEKVSDGRV